MNYLLDTCIISEYTRRRPSPKVINWLGEAEEQGLFLSALTLGELMHGVERLPAGERKSALALWLREELVPRFDRRLIPLDAPVMLAWGALVARLEAVGRPMALMDSLIAATALCHDMVVVTRNESDFLPSGVPLFNPWK